MNIKPFLRATQQFLSNNSPTVLTTVGVLGTITTAVWTGKAAYSSALLLWEANNTRCVDNEPPLTKREEVELIWKLYIPPAVIGAFTLAAVIGSNRIATRRVTALATGFALSEKMAEEYRQKVLETIGVQKEEMIRSEVAKDRISRVEDLDSLIITGAQELYYDSWSARVFLATREQVEQAVNQINYQINQQWSASLSEFYDLLGLPRTAVSDEFGWNSDRMLEPYYTATLVGNQRPAVEIRFDTLPFRQFNAIGV